MFKNYQINTKISLLQSDSYYNKRQKAIEALKKLDDGSVVDRLISLLEGSGVQNKRGIVWALGEMGDKKAIGPLIKALGVEDRSIEREAVEALGKFKDERIYDVLVNEMQKDGSTDSRHGWALGNLGDNRAQGPLIVALGHWYGYLRSEAAASLDKLGDSRWINKIKGKNEDFMVLGEIGEPVHFPALITSLKSDGSDDPRNCRSGPGTNGRRTCSGTAFREISG